MPKFFIAKSTKSRFEVDRNRIRFAELGIQDFSVVTDATDRTDFFAVGPTFFAVGTSFSEREISERKKIRTTVIFFDEINLTQLIFADLGMVDLILTFKSCGRRFKSWSKSCNKETLHVTHIVLENRHKWPLRLADIDALVPISVHAWNPHLWSML